MCQVGLMSPDKSFQLVIEMRPQEHGWNGFLLKLLTYDFRQEIQQTSPLQLERWELMEEHELARYEAMGTQAIAGHVVWVVILWLMWCFHAVVASYILDEPADHADSVDHLRFLCDLRICTMCWIGNRRSHVLILWALLITYLVIESPGLLVSTVVLNQSPVDCLEGCAYFHRFHWNCIFRCDIYYCITYHAVQLIIQIIQLSRTVMIPVDTQWDGNWHLQDQAFLQRRFQHRSAGLMRLWLIFDPLLPVHFAQLHA